MSAIVIHGEHGVCCASDDPEYLCDECKERYMSSRMLQPVSNASAWEAAYQEQALDPSGNGAYRRAVANAKSQASLSDLSGDFGSSVAAGTTGSPLGGGMFSGPGRQHGDGADTGSEYHDHPIEKVPNGSGRVRKALKALANLDDDEVDELMDAIASDGRYVAKLMRQTAGALGSGFDRGAQRSPQSLYGGVGGPMRNVATAADYLAGWPVRNEYLADVFARDPTLNAARQKRDPMASSECAWAAAYEENSAMSELPRGY